MKTKSTLHPNNKHTGRYDFEKLVASCPELSEYVFVNKYGSETIDFSNPKAVKLLNKALLQTHYDIKGWDIPQGYLCPPIPGRADYIHYIAELVGKAKKVTALDIGVGANCIYPLIGNRDYKWKFIGSDIDPNALENANEIIQNNELNKYIELRFQANEKNIFKGIIEKNDKIAVTICNPPFHASAEDAMNASLRKEQNLKKRRINKPTLNFGGQHKELWCNGGEREFIKNMIRESVGYKDQIEWFTTLVSREAHLDAVYQTLKKVNPKEVKTINMGQGNKISRIVAWKF